MPHFIILLVPGLEKAEVSAKGSAEENIGGGDQSGRRRRKHRRRQLPTVLAAPPGLLLPPSTHVSSCLCAPLFVNFCGLSTLRFYEVPGTFLVRHLYSIIQSEWSRRLSVSVKSVHRSLRGDFPPESA